MEPVVARQPDHGLYEIANRTLEAHGEPLYDGRRSAAFFAPDGTVTFLTDSRDGINAWIYPGQDDAFFYADYVTLAPGEALNAHRSRSPLRDGQTHGSEQIIGWQLSDESVATLRTRLVFTMEYPADEELSMDVRGRFDADAGVSQGWSEIPYSDGARDAAIATRSARGNGAGREIS